jgi:hypothetical protein
MRRPFPLLFFNTSFALSSAFSAASPPGPSDFERVFLELFAGASGTGTELLLLPEALGWKAMDLRERLGRGASPDIVYGLRG